jgi:hypothetical protein
MRRPAPVRLSRRCADSPLWVLSVELLSARRVVRWTKQRIWAEVLADLPKVVGRCGKETVGRVWDGLA